MRRLFLFCAAAGFFLLLGGYLAATATPIVRALRVTLPGYPKNAPRFRIVLMTDLHVAGPDMPPDRLATIVDQVNALRPDVVAVTGDLVSDKTLATRSYPFDAAVAPLARLRPRRGVAVVLGNHDYWRDGAAAATALRRIGIEPLVNQARRFGPVTIGGVDDAYAGRPDPAATAAAIDRLGGVPVLISHSPDVFPGLPSRVRLALAGHTHCGQIALPIVGPLATAANTGRRYACGVIREGGRTLVVGAGLGTSVVPLRLGTRPDLWLIEIDGAEGGR